MKILIVVDHLRIGGIERLALDQAYELADRGVEFALINLNLEVTTQNPNFLSQSGESSFIKRIRLINAPKGRIRQFSFILRILAVHRPQLVISHSLRASVLFFIARFLRPGHKINTTIHQLPSLSDRRQRIKRFLYSQFTDSLFAYSEAVRRDWNENIQSNLLLRKLCRKKINVLRNGIYLNRLNLNNYTIYPKSPIYSSERRIIFIGRAVGWKGLNKFREISRSFIASQVTFIIYVPSISAQTKSELKGELGNRLELVVGSTLANFQRQPGDVHFYPVNYGKNCAHIESISLNCLEMAALGVQSFVTKGGVDTWPDLAELGAFLEQNWEDLSNLYARMGSLNLNGISGSSLLRVRELLDVKNNLERHLKEANLTLGRLV